MAPTLATLALVALVALSAVAAQAACPSLTENKACSTGSCASGGLAGTWKIPEFPGRTCTKLPCQFEGTFIIGGQTITSFTSMTTAKCCKKCKNKKSCKFWQYIDGVCFLYSGAGPTCGGSATSRAGGKCQDPEIKDDPHLIGAHGTHYDFSGQPDKSFCLLTDRNLHINMKMTGYLDERTESATLMQDGKALRTWIREVGILWSAEGHQHTLRLVARSGGETVRGEGFLAVAEADSEVLPRMQPGNELKLTGGLIIKMEAVEKKGPYDVDYYRVRIGDLLDMDVRLRVANPLLQRPDDAEAHISLGISSVKTTPVVHGILGQTYREGREERAVEFSKISALLNQPIAADGETGKGFLDGRSQDYISSDVLAADCRFTGFAGHILPTSVSSE